MQETRRPASPWDYTGCPIHPKEIPVVLCPVAVAVGCKKCPVFNVCPAKSIIGDQPKSGEKAAAEAKGKDKVKSP
jgi:hypothetical protein